MPADTNWGENCYSLPGLWAMRQRPFFFIPRPNYCHKRYGLKLKILGESDLDSWKQGKLRNEPNKYSVFNKWCEWSWKMRMDQRLQFSPARAMTMFTLAAKHVTWPPIAWVARRWRRSAGWPATRKRDARPLRVARRFWCGMLALNLMLIFAGAFL